MSDWEILHVHISVYFQTRTSGQLPPKPRFLLCAACGDPPAVEAESDLDNDHEILIQICLHWQNSHLAK